MAGLGSTEGDGLRGRMARMGDGRGLGVMIHIYIIYIDIKRWFKSLPWCCLRRGARGKGREGKD